MSLLHALTSLLSEFLEMKLSQGKYILLHSLHGQEGTPLKFLQVFEMSSHLLLNCLKNKPVKSKLGFTFSWLWYTHLDIIFLRYLEVWWIYRKSWKNFILVNIYFSELGRELSSSDTVHQHIPNGPTCSGTLPHGEIIIFLRGERVGLHIDSMAL